MVAMTDTHHGVHELTEAEMDELTIADANDPSAWGDPIVVPASKSRKLPPPDNDPSRQAP